MKVLIVSVLAVLSLSSCSTSPEFRELVKSKLIGESIDCCKAIGKHEKVVIHIINQCSVTESQ